MVINNPYYIKTEIKKEKPVEIVHELKDEYKIPSFEEFMKTYDEPNEESEFLAETEYQDRVLNGPKYGPGNEKKNKGKKKTSDNGIECNGQHLINTLNSWRGLLEGGVEFSASLAINKEVKRRKQFWRESFLFLSAVIFLIFFGAVVIYIKESIQ